MTVFVQILCKWKRGSNFQSLNPLVSFVDSTDIFSNSFRQDLQSLTLLKRYLSIEWSHYIIQPTFPISLNSNKLKELFKLNIYNIIANRALKRFRKDCIKTSCLRLKKRLEMTRPCKKAKGIQINILLVVAKENHKRPNNTKAKTIIKKSIKVFPLCNSWIVFTPIFSLIAETGVWMSHKTFVFCILSF